ncbi:MAG: DUF4910 domain-containing protein [Rhodospirillaceae bacterium]|jgi:aminopeptidase-like protein|nr:DUF4910 domain-containing protein [Rhodospirillaceae bacterium]MBT5667654.1 DUF4910 domain-containing protein [Rhodospirillaceae bacterium]
MVTPDGDIFPNAYAPAVENSENMWALMEELFPHYRALCGPGFHDSLKRISRHVALDISEFPSGTDVMGWLIPKEFQPNEVWVEDSNGDRVIDSANESYHVLLYGQPFDGVIDRDELIRHIEIHSHLDDAVPLRQTYYRERWGLCASKKQVEALAPGNYHVHIDVAQFDGSLRIGDAFLPGESKQEILLNTYLCHPKGANDNLSSVVVAVELFRMLSALPRRHFSYRLALWPESIGAIAYIANYPDRLKRTVGGYSFMMCGDAAPIRFTGTFEANSVFDRAARHALRWNEMPDEPLPYSRWTGGSDAMHFDSAGLRIPFCTFTRGGPNLDLYPAYHSSADDLSLVKPEYLFETLKVAWDAIMTVERAVTYQANYTVDPFLSKYGIFPYQHGAGDGKHGNLIARAYFELMGSLDGKLDLLSIAEKYDMPIEAFDEPVEKFLEKKLISKVDEVSPFNASEMP